MSESASSHYCTCSSSFYTAAATADNSELSAGASETDWLPCSLEGWSGDDDLSDQGDPADENSLFYLVSDLLILVELAPSSLLAQNHISDSKPRRSAVEASCVRAQDVPTVALAEDVYNTLSHELQHIRLHSEQIL